MRFGKINNTILFIGLITITLFLFLVDLGVGSVAIPVSEVWHSLFDEDYDSVIRSIVIDIRLNKAIVALLCGSALSVSGLQMQTLFKNPLAGPYVLGISSGASLGVALFILGMPLFGLSSALFSIGLAGAAWIGSAMILIIISIVSYRLKDIMVVLILGMMFSSGVSAIVQILQYLSDDEALKSYVIWTMGSLGDVQGPELVILTAAVVSGLILAVLAIKPLNQLLLGEEYAITMGMNVRRSRSFLFLSTTLLAGTVTAFCGPIGFIGMAIPHVTRNLFSNSDHRILVPANILTGALILIICDIFSKAFLLPINAITALLGIPVIIVIVLRNKTFSI
ncbi:MAG: iron ABC transporter permease [Muribaculaceae bacterium]|nr:iron ABC transporter permease [Muribaculaceae bacterium]